MAPAKDGDTVRIHYTGKLQDGTVFDTSEGRDPLSFTIGSGQVIPGFEDAVRGMVQNETKNVKIPMDQAYGPRNEELMINVPRNQVPPEINPEPGQRLQIQGPGNQPMLVVVKEVTETSIILDANPPLAGEDLIFDIELLEIA